MNIRGRKFKFKKQRYILILNELEKTPSGLTAREIMV